MAILTWRNVETPNTLPAALAAGEVGDRVSQAFNNLATGLGQFGQAQTDRADALALQAAGQITDSAAYAKALADGSILRDAGINPNQVSARVSQMLAQRQNDLLANDYQQAQIENQRQDNQLARDRFTLDKTQADITNTRDQYRFGREQLNNQRSDQELVDSRAAQQLAFDIQNAGVDASGARELIRQSGASPRIQSAVAGMLKLGGGGIVPSAPVDTSGMAGADAFYGYGAHGVVPSKRLSQGSFGEAYDFGQTLIPATRGQVGAGADKGTSAVGAYQFIGDTMQQYAQKVFGNDWRSVPFNFENQSKIAEALFNDKKDGNLKEVWAGLPDARPGAYKDMSFEQFQREVLPRESGMTLDQIRASEAQNLQAQVNNSLATTEAVSLGMQGNAAQRLGNIDLNQFFKDSNNKDPDLAKAAATATKEYPSLKGTELNKVAGWIDTIQQKAAADGTPLTAAQATHILGASMSPSGTFSIHPFAGAESGMFFDESKMEQVLKDVNQGGNIGRAIVSNQIQADMSQANNAATALQAAVKHNQELQSRVAQGLPVSKDALDKASAALMKALKRNDELNSKFSDPAYQQKLTESTAEVARKQEADKSAAAARFAPVPTGSAQGIGYAPATAITTGLPNRASSLIEQRLGR